MKLTTPILPLVLHLRATGAQPLACALGAHIIVARASTEKPGTGTIGIIANRVANRIPGSDIVAVEYPATLGDYVESETAGVVEMRRLVVEYAAACPQGKIVLMGYSQGAHVSADVVCGNTEDGFPQSDPLSVDVSEKISAIVMMGDPSHSSSAAFNRGTSIKDGLFPRQNNAGCAAVQSKMVSYCDTGDRFCDRGDDEGVHRQYIQIYGAEAVNFVVSKVNGLQEK
ncbi:cutinase [Apodospora peruviana]|uniref:Cutinase n=1 Tax=Apodospora peruviana TaxID=516989 RepID=A0AAE0I0X1_9PEZI|nr:cutinase [Apodospora peruviana]